MAQHTGVVKCHYCGHKLSRKNHTIDHVKPLAKGGKDKKWNKVDACNTCNQEKGCLTVDEFRAVLAFRADRMNSAFWYTFEGESE